MPQIIREVKERSKTRILAGGLIRTEEEVQNALNAGTDAITTSKRELWKLFER